MSFFRKAFFLFAALISMTIVSAETIVLNKSTELKWDPTVTISESKFKNLSTGNELTISYSLTSANYHQIKLYSGNWSPLTEGTIKGASNENGILTPSSTSGTIVYAATQNEINSIKQSGLRMHGFGVKITKISFDSSSKKSVPKEDSPTIKSNPNGNSSTIYNKSTDLDWSSYILIDSEKFSSLKKDCCIKIKYENTSANYHNIKIYSGAWSNLGSGELTGASNNGGVLIPSTDSGFIFYIPTQSEIDSLKSSGLRIHGFGSTIKEISITSKDFKIDSNKKPESNAPTNETPTKPESFTPTSETSTSKPVTTKGTPFANHGALHVSGAYLYDSKNEKYQLYGMSTHGINFGNEFSRYINKKSFQTLRDNWNTNCIRLAMYPKDYNGYCNGGNKEQLKKIICDGIDFATELGMYVIVDWHVHNYNPNETYSDAVSFLNEISAKYSKHDNVLYEICNEPTNSPWNSVIKPYAEKIIPVIRKNAPNAVILVGTNTWSQDIEGPLANPLSYKNVMYVFHFYANTHTSSFRSRVENAIKKGLPIFITEFGTCDASGNGGFNPKESEKWFELCKKYNISHMNWSLSNKSETASAIKNSCNKISDWTYDDLTESGKLIYNHFRSLQK